MKESEPEGLGGSRRGKGIGEVKQILFNCHFNISYYISVATVHVNILSPIKVFYVEVLTVVQYV